MTLKNYIFSGHTSTSNSVEFGSLLLRLFAGLSLALAHGMGKLPPSEGFIGLVAALGFPLPFVFAWAEALTEFVGGLFLAAGFLTRPAAGFIAIAMAVAAFLQHAHDPFGRKELALMYFFIAVFYLCKGAGRWSIDRLIR